jgi:CRP-like cAMP-binding protein
LKRLRNVFLIDAGAENDHRNIAELAALIEFDEELFSIHQGHIEVQKNKVGLDLSLQQLGQCVFSRDGREAANRRGYTLDQLDHQLMIIYVIINEKTGKFLHARCLIVFEKRLKCNENQGTMDAIIKAPPGLAFHRRTALALKACWPALFFAKNRDLQDKSWLKVSRSSKLKRGWSRCPRKDEELIIFDVNLRASMDYSTVLQNVGKHIVINEEEVGYFTTLLSVKEFRKKEFVLKEGQLCPFIYYVHEGTLRAYFRDRDGNESIVMFAINDWWITDMYSFATNNPAMLNIDALENSTVFQLQKEDLEELYKKVPRFERFFRIIMQNAYIREQLRIIQNLSMPAEERYNTFLKKYPQFARRVPLKQIASYLGITPEFLSVLRRKAARPPMIRDE